MYIVSTFFTSLTYLITFKTIELDPIPSKIIHCQTNQEPKPRKLHYTYLFNSHKECRKDDSPKYSSKSAIVVISAADSSLDQMKKWWRVKNSFMSDFEFNDDQFQRQNDWSSSAEGVEGLHPQPGDLWRGWRHRGGLHGQRVEGQGSPPVCPHLQQVFQHSKLFNFP